MLKALGIEKVPDYLVEEDDFFGTFINKRLRKFKKKLKEIEELEAKGKDLDPSQQEKISLKSEILENASLCEELLKAYVCAYCDTLDGKVELKVRLTPGKKELKKLEKKQAKEGKPITPKTEEPTKKEEKKPAVASKQPEKAVETPVETEPAEAINNILNLVHSALFLGDAHRGSDLKIESGDAEVIQEFYSKVFTYTDSSRFSNNEEKIQESVKELRKFLNKDASSAVQNKSYAQLFDTVTRIAKTDSFKHKSAEPVVHHGKHDTKPQGAIGSEIKHSKAPVVEVPASHHKEQAAPEKPAQQASPVKEQPHPEEPAKTEAPKQSGQPNWADEPYEDEDESPYEGENFSPPVRAGPSSGEERNSDDEWHVVGKKPAGEGRGRGGRGRGAGRGGPRPGGRGGRGPRPDGDRPRGPRRPPTAGAEGQPEGGEGGAQPEHHEGEGAPRGRGRGGRGRGRGRGGPREGGEGHYEGPREGGFRRGGRGGPREGGDGEFRGRGRGGPRPQTGVPTEAAGQQ